MKVTIDIPDSYALYFSLSALSGLEKQFKLFTALMLIKQGKISVSKGAELAEITIYDFLKECKENDIPVIDYSKKELDEEFANIRKELPWRGDHASECWNVGMLGC